MKFKKSILFLLIFNFSFISTSSNSIITFYSYDSNHIPQSCTIFTVTIGDKVFFGNNEDYLLEGTYAWFFPSQELETPNGTIQTHGAMFFGFDNNNHPGDGYAQGGMNDQGLCFDGNGLPVIPMNAHPEREETHPYFHVFMEILWKCSTVNETIQFFETHNLGSAIACQIHFADAMGDAVVISGGTDGEFAYTHIGNSTHLVSTNFNLANPSNGWYPCWRYDCASFYLEHINSEEELTINACRDVLNAVSVSATVYSNIFNLVHHDIYIYHNHNFNEVVKLNLEEELKNITSGVNGVKTTLGTSAWVLYGISSKAYSINFFFVTPPPERPPPNPTPSNPSSLNPLLLFPVIFGIISLAISLTVITIFGSKFLINFFKKNRIK